MPWYVHRTGQEFFVGTLFYTRQTAQQCRQATVDATGEPDWTITFHIEMYERIEWWRREQNRLDEGYYSPTPWSSEEWASYGVAESDPQSIVYRHYAHLSVEHPNLIAYTPNDEYGIEDRQLRVRPGKYLAEFASHLDKKTIDRFCAECRKFDSAIELKFARTPDEIQAVYENGPDSCMSGKHKYSENPVRAYGDSDLAIAYIGDLKRAQARGICWPERKQYNRLYGNEHVLRIQLEKAGFTYARALWGARFRAIDAASGYLMPYVDCGSMANLVYEDGRLWFRLTPHGSIETMTTDGYVVDDDPPEDEDDYAICAHCDDRCEEVDQEYCYTCRRARYVCAKCDDVHFDRIYSMYIARLGRFCPACYDGLQIKCAIETCEITFCEEETFTERESDERNEIGVQALCFTCAQLYRPCHSCKTYRPIDTLHVPCECGIADRCSETANLSLESANA